MPGTSSQMRAGSAPARHPGHASDEPVPDTLGAPTWTQDTVWTSTVAALSNFPDGLSVLELCAGAGTASIALMMLLGQAKPRLAGAWDIADDLQDIHLRVHGHGAPVHLGARAGDIMAMEPAMFPCANCVVCGPPCPPFSSCGSRLALDDTRARPFERCMEVIADLDSRADRGEASQELMFFMLENVPGIAFCTGQRGHSALDILLTTLRRRLGNSWMVQPTRVNAMDFGLPHNRERIYVVGRKAKFYPQGLPARPLHFARRVSPIELLDLTDTAEATYTPLQARCLANMKQLYLPAMVNPANRGKCAFVEIGRDPTARTTWSSGRSAPVDRCQCLRANGPQIHVFALGEGTGHLSLDRCLRVRERAALQGFPAAIGQLRFSEAVGRRVFGNAMTVPVVGSLLAQELLCLQETLPASKLAKALGKTGPPGAPSLVIVAETQPVSRGQGPQPAPERQEAEAAAEEQMAILPGQLAASVAWATAIARHWVEGRPGRAPRPAVVLGPADHAAVAKRRRLGHRSSSAGSGHPRDGHLESSPCPATAASAGDDLPAESSESEAPFEGFA